MSAPPPQKKTHKKTARNGVDVVPEQLNTSTPAFPKGLWSNWPTTVIHSFCYIVPPTLINGV